jgi:prevent-host-death family protein
MSTINMRELSRNTKSVIEEVVRSGRPAIITVHGRPQAAITPLVGAVEAAEEHVLRNAPAQVERAVREGEADLIGGQASVVDDSVFANLEPEEEPADADLVAALAARIDTAPLEDAIRSAPSRPDPVEAVREALMQVNVFAIGRPAGDLSVPGQGAESVTYATDEGRSVLMPVFTAVDALREALIRVPEWRSLAILEVNGRELVRNVDPDVTLVIDPGSDLEFHLPPTGRRTLVAEAPIMAASDLVPEPA